MSNEKFQYSNWQELVKKASKMGVYKQGMSKAETIAALQKEGIEVTEDGDGFFENVLKTAWNFLKSTFERLKKKIDIRIRLYYNADEDRLKIELRLGENGPVITRRPVDQKEAKRIMNDIDKGHIRALTRNQNVGKVSRIKKALKNG